MGLWKQVFDRVQGKAPPGAKRSPAWRTVRREYIKAFDSCECCDRKGARYQLEAHHVIPYHLAPDMELDFMNIMTMCRRCHLIIGHLGGWARINPQVVAWSAFMLAAVRAAK